MILYQLSFNPWELSQEIKGNNLLRYYIVCRSNVVGYIHFIFSYKISTTRVANYKQDTGVFACFPKILAALYCGAIRCVSYWLL